MDANSLQIELSWLMMFKIIVGAAITYFLLPTLLVIREWTILIFVERVLFNKKFDEALIDLDDTYFHRESAIKLHMHHDYLADNPKYYFGPREVSKAAYQYATQMSNMDKHERRIRHFIQRRIFTYKSVSKVFKSDTSPGYLDSIFNEVGRIEQEYEKRFEDARNSKPDLQFIADELFEIEEGLRAGRTRPRLQEDF